MEVSALQGLDEIEHTNMALDRKQFEDLTMTMSEKYGYYDGE